MTFNNRSTRFARQFLALASCLTGALLAPGPATAGLGDVFTIDMENHNLIQPSGQSGPAQLLGNSAAPYLNSLMTAGNPNAAQTSYASNYQSVGASVHPSLPNYLWQESGTNNGVMNDNQPFGPGGANQGNAPSLTGLLQNAGISWKSYQEDTNLDANGKVLPQSQWTVPLNNASGTFGNGYANAYNGSNQYNFATKHDGSLYYNATNGGPGPNGNGDTSTSNPAIPHYAPIQQLTTDLNTNNIARYNLITPDQFNDMHTALANGFTYNGVSYTGDQAAVAQGDNFLSKIIPQIMASQAYQNNGAIVIWFDETEGGDSSAYKLAEIVISKLAKGNAYDSTLNYTHSSDLKTLQELYGVSAPGGGFLGDANTPGTNDLSDLFVPGAIVPEPSSIALTGLGLAAAAVFGRRRPARKFA